MYSRCGIFFSNTEQHSIDQIHAICFVVQASQARLTATQKYVFDAIMALFGKDVAKNIMLLITFADGGPPMVRDAITEANFPFATDTLFTFNNSALFADNGTMGDNSNMQKWLWDMGEKSMMQLFAALNQLEPVSLTLSLEVLEKRRRLDTALEGLHEKIKTTCIKMDELKRERKALADNERQIRANLDFDYKVSVQKCRVPSILNEYITNCANCHVTCHYPCTVADNKDKMYCTAMEINSKGETVCTVCPGNCSWTVHYNDDYRFKFYTETVTRTFSELKDMYNCAPGQKIALEELIEKLEEDLVAVQLCAYFLIKEARECLERLQKIALKPNPLSTVEYVDLLIQTEKNECKDGWKERVDALNQLQKEADIFEDRLNARKGSLSENMEALVVSDKDVHKRAQLIEKMLNSLSNPLEENAVKLNRKEKGDKTGIFDKIFRGFRGLAFLR